MVHYVFVSHGSLLKYLLSRKRRANCYEIAELVINLRPNRETKIQHKLVNHCVIGSERLWSYYTVNALALR